jgi:hypothetical protein
MRTVVFGTAVIAGVVWLSIATANPHSGLSAALLPTIWLPRIPCFFDRLGRRLRAAPMGSFVQLPLTLAPALERLTRRVIARVPCLGGLMAATPSGICRGRLNGNGGTSQETSNSRS